MEVIERTIEYSSKDKFTLYPLGDMHLGVTHCAEELPMRYQEGVVIHEIIETYLQFLPHDKVIELTGYIQNGLQQLSKVIPKCFDE